MSYDLTIASRSRPDAAQLAAWAQAKRVDLRSNGGGFAVFSSSTSEHPYFVVEQPLSARAEDFDDQLAAACLAPEWMTMVMVAYDGPKRAFELARSLAKHLAEETDGAAFDPQEEALVWPRGRPKRVPAASGERPVDVVELAWLVAPQRWQRAPHVLLDELGRRCPEALPRRYGDVEPAEHTFDPADPAAFREYLLASSDHAAFWSASRPAFGGFANAPAQSLRGFESCPQVGCLKVSFDATFLREDERWLETVVQLFAAVAREAGCFFAAASVETGWIASRNNGLSIPAAPSLENSRQHFSSTWFGLPPDPVWLTWFGAPYRPRVDSALDPAEAAAPARRANRFARLVGRRGPRARDGISVTDSPPGALLRLSHEPRLHGDLPRPRIDPGLVYAPPPPLASGVVMAGSLPTARATDIPSLS